MVPGSVVLVDNALMSGTVATGKTNGHWDQASVDGQRSFNERFCAHPNLDAIVLPVGDGLAVGVVR
jgi:predicted O-methyltransferase YrrM